MLISSFETENYVTCLSKRKTVNGRGFRFNLGLFLRTRVTEISKKFSNEELKGDLNRIRNFSILMSIFPTKTILFFTENQFSDMRDEHCICVVRQEDRKLHNTYCT